MEPPRNWLEAVQQYLPWADAETAEVVKIKAEVPATASPEEALQFLDDFMTMNHIAKREE